MSLLAALSDGPPGSTPPTPEEPPFQKLLNTISGEGQQGLSADENANLVELATMFANIAIIIGAGVATISLAYAFFMYITSAGDPKSVQRASRALLWGIISLLVCLAAWGIKAITFKLIGVEGIA